MMLILKRNWIKIILLKDNRQLTKERIEISYEKKQIIIINERGDFVKELNNLEYDNLIDETINISILSKLLKMNLIDDNEFKILREEIKKFY